MVGRQLCLFSEGKSGPSDGELAGEPVLFCRIVLFFIKSMQKNIRGRFVWGYPWGYPLGNNLPIKKKSMNFLLTVGWPSPI